MEYDLNMQLEPASPPSHSWRRGAVRLLAAAAVLLAVMWGETWAIEHSAELVAYARPAHAGSSTGTHGQDCAANAIPIATLH
jgi:hypothetical protein